MTTFLRAMVVGCIAMMCASAGFADQGDGAAKSFLEKTKAEAVSAPDALIPDYKIGEQDVLRITVWKESDLSTDVTVRPDGKITVPLLNDLSVVGMTPGELQTLLTDKLEAYVKVPQVTVTVKEINSRKVYVVGEVNKAGLYKINSSTTVLQMLSEAGGLREFARSKRIYVLRNEAGKQARYGFNYNEVVRGKKPEQNIVLRPGDTIIVP